MSKSMYWHRKGGLASWEYRFEYDLQALNNPTIRKQWVVNVTQSLFNLLKPFATPIDAEVWTFSQGEDAFVIKSEEPAFQEKLFQFLLAADDVTDVTIHLDLHCYEVDEQLQKNKLTLRDAGFLWLYIGLDEIGKLKTPETCLDDDPIKLVLSIDTDIYAPLLGETKQGFMAAKINAPILKEFLKRLENELSLEQTDRNDPWYMREYLEQL